VKITLIHLGVRSFLFKILMGWVITCSIVRILLNIKSIITLILIKKIKYLIEINFMRIDYSQSLVRLF
jgi:hypothetical protein